VLGSKTQDGEKEKGGVVDLRREGADPKAKSETSVTWIQLSLKREKNPSGKTRPPCPKREKGAMETSTELKGWALTGLRPCKRGGG